MQEKKELNQSKDYFFLPQFLDFQQQKERLKCPNQNQANYVCISFECLKPGLTCRQSKCSCIKQHQNCHHTVLDRVLKSIQKHQKKEIPQKVKEIYKTIYQIINQMIQKLSQIRIKFQRQQRYFGLQQEEIQFMELLSQSRIDEINGKIINSLQKTFDTEIQLSENSREDIIKDFQSKRKIFDKICNNIEKGYTQIYSKNKKYKIIYSRFFQDSKIIQKNQEKEILNQWLRQCFNDNDIQSKLLFRASQHNFSSQKFHQFCDGRQNTIVIVKNNYDKIIGGFTPVPWHSQGTSVFDYSYKTFLFSLSLKQKYKYMKKEYKCIGCYNYYGPIFGDASQFNGGKDLSIANDCNASTSQNSFGDIFTFNLQTSQNVKKYKQSSQETYTLFTGNPDGNHFRVLEYQVYQIAEKTL